MGAEQRRARGGFVVVGGILYKVNAYGGRPGRQRQPFIPPAIFLTIGIEGKHLNAKRLR